MMKTTGRPQLEKLKNVTIDLMYRGESFRFSKEVLIECVPAFRMIFAHPSQESFSNYLKLDHIEPVTMACLLTYLATESYLSALPSKAFDAATLPRPTLPICYSAAPSITTNVIDFQHTSTATPKNVNPRDVMAEDQDEEPASKRPKLTAGEAGGSAAQVVLVRFEKASEEAGIEQRTMLEQSAKAEGPSVVKTESMPLKHQDVITHLGVIIFADMYAMDTLNGIAKRLFFESLGEELFTPGFATALERILGIALDHETLTGAIFHFVCVESETIPSDIEAVCKGFNAAVWEGVSRARATIKSLREEKISYGNEIEELYDEQRTLEKERSDLKGEFEQEREELRLELQSEIEENNAKLETCLKEKGTTEKRLESRDKMFAMIAQISKCEGDCATDFVDRYIKISASGDLSLACDSCDKETKLKCQCGSIEGPIDDTSDGAASR